MNEASGAELGASWNEAMLCGDFERAWQASDQIRALGVDDPHRFWNGQPITGRRVMLRCLHGFGDAVQFLRYVPRLRAAAESVCVEVAPRFVDLAHCLTGVEHVITWGERAPAPPPSWDLQIEVMELPYIFRTQLAELPIAVQYLRRPPPASEPEASPLLRVGLALRAGQWNVSRSIAEDLVRPVIQVAGCEFWNLGEEPAGVSSAMKEDAQCRMSLIGLAQRISNLDLVVSVDTLAAHVAGAMGVPAWVMLQHAADWRWMQARDDSPWYPSLRLFRQASADDWRGVVNRVAAALQRLASVHGAGHAP